MSEAIEVACRYRYGRPDVNSAGGVLYADVIALAASEPAAKEAASQEVGDPSALRMVETGPTVLAEAKALGLKVGEARHL